MSLTYEMQESISRLAGARKPGDTRESMIARAAKAAGISFRQAKSFFYAETENPRGKAIEAVRAAVERNNQKIEKAAADELSDLRARIARLERLLDAAGSYMARTAHPQGRPVDLGQG